MSSSDSGSRYNWGGNLGKILKDNKPFLLFDTDREYLAKLFHKLKYKVGAEIGVGGGVYSEMICRHNPGVLLYAVDAWAAYDGYMDFTDQEYLEIDYQMAIKRLEPYGAVIKRMWSMEAVDDFEDGSLDFVYIDANHEAPQIIDDVHHWAQKVRSGGIVSGHDYVLIHKDVIKAVDDYVNGHSCRPLFLVGNQNEREEQMTICSWFWVQP